MNEKISIVFIVVLLLCLGLSGCQEKNNNGENEEPNGQEYANDTEKFVGTWNTSEPIQWYIKPSFTFFANSTFVVGSYGGTYLVEDNELVLHWKDGETVYTYNYMFLDNNTVSLTYIDTGDNGIYKRQ